MADRADLASSGPRPEIDADNRPFWEAIDEGHLLVWRCAECGQSFLPPLPGCPHCGSRDHGPTAASGRGRLESWIVVHRAMSDAFVDDVPYVVGAVVLDEGARVFARLLADPDDIDLHDGLPVRFAPTRRGDQIIVAFSPEVSAS
jgi:uncharacterized OB-fold protein